MSSLSSFTVTRELSEKLESKTPPSSATFSCCQPGTVDDLLAEIGAVSETPEEEFEGDYIESPEDTAERWNADTEGRGAAQPMREIVAMLKTDEFDDFADDLRTLREAYELEATTATVREAVRREAQKARNG